MVQQLPLVAFPVLSVGCDWVTATCIPEKGSLLLDSFGDRVIGHERDLGNYVRPWSGFGYQGYSCGQFSLGSREDGWMFQCRGDCAHTFAAELVGFADNVSRFDLEATFQLGSDYKQIMESEYTAAECFKPARGPKPKVRLDVDTQGGYCYWIGQRTSDRMLRSYDKWAESKGRWPRGAVRYEAQNMRKAAFFAAHVFSRSVDRQSSTIGFLSAMFAARGVPLGPWFNCPHYLMPSDESRAPRHLADTDRQLEWLHTQVAPVVQKLRARDLTNKVLDSLGLTDYASDSIGK